MVSLTLGCQYLLPSGEASGSQFKSFEAARDAFESVVPGETTVEELTELGIDPRQRGVQIRPYVDVARFFLPHAGASLDLHDPAVGACVRAGRRCDVWFVSADRSKGKRVSNIILDVLEFHRKSDIRGFLFQGLVLVVDEVATYRIYGGRPHLRYVDQRVQPLGFLQEGPKVKVMPLGSGGFDVTFGKQAIATMDERPLETVDPIVGVFEAEKIERDERNSGERVRDSLQ